MRLVAGALAVVLAHSLALADTPRPVRVDPKPTMQLEVPQPTRTKVPVRVVRILPESKQAVLLDRTGGAQVVVSVGDKIGGYVVDSIDEDEVTLLAQGKEVVLTAPSSTWLPISAIPAPAPAPTPAPVAAAAPAPAPSAGPALEDPYGASAPAPAPAAGSTEPLDPYADQQPVREVKVPSWIDPVDPSAPAVEAPAPTAEAAPAPAPAPAPASEPATPYDDTAPATSCAPAAGPAPAAAPAPAPADPSLSRRDVSAALSDFAGLTAAMRASFTPAGTKIESIADGSLFAKAGLRAGDVITSIDGKPLRSLDDVAALYARAAKLRLVTAQVVRGGKPITLRVTIQ